MNRHKRLSVLLLLVALTLAPASAQRLFHRIDSILAANYYSMTNVDTTYISRPATRWRLSAWMDVTGAKIEAEGLDAQRHFKAEMEANRKTTLSIGVNYLGIGLSVSVNPAKLMGKYRDFEIEFNSYGRRFGIDAVYHDAKNYRGWHDHEGMERIHLPDGLLHVRTLNVNAFYVFNCRRFSYPAAFSQSDIQRRSAGSFLLAASAQGQRTSLDWEQPMTLKTTNVALGAGYGYNYVPSQGWLLHLSAVPTFIVYSRTSMTFGDQHIPLRYHFPEVIITGRGALVRHWSNKYFGLSMIFNFTNNGYKNNLAIHNIKWHIRTFIGIRL